MNLILERAAVAPFPKSWWSISTWRRFSSMTVALHVNTKMELLSVRVYSEVKCVYPPSGQGNFRLKMIYLFLNFVKLFRFVFVERKRKSFSIWNCLRSWAFPSCSTGIFNTQILKLLLQRNFILLAENYIDSVSEVISRVFWRWKVSWIKFSRKKEHLMLLMVSQQAVRAMFELIFLCPKPSAGILSILISCICPLLRLLVTSSPGADDSKLLSNYVISDLLDVLL